MITFQIYIHLQNHNFVDTEMTEPNKEVNDDQGQSIKKQGIPIPYLTRDAPKFKQGDSIYNGQKHFEIDYLDSVKPFKHIYRSSSMVFQPHSPIQPSPRLRQYSFCELECKLCLEIVTDDQFVSFYVCSHRFCIKCSIKNIKQELESLHQIMCPRSGCGALLKASSDIFPYLTENELEKLAKFGFKPAQNIEISIQKGSKMQKYDKKIPQEIAEQKMLTRKPSADNKTSAHLNKNEQNRVEQNIRIEQLGGSSSFSLTNKIEMGDYKIIKPVEVEVNNEKDFVFPVKCFDLMCASIWQKKWFNFLKMLPISIIAILLLVLLTLAWAFIVSLYFISVWIICIPLVWAMYEIWGCFTRTIKIKYLRNIIFTFCIICFPLLLLFFFLVSLSIVFYDTIYKQDMKQILAGRTQNLLNRGKIHLNSGHSPHLQCKCKISQKCSKCSSKNSFLCLVF